MKRGAGLNRNEHATGREQATIEVAERYPLAQGLRATEPKRRLWRMKRGAVVDRNEHASGSEQATIEVADRGGLERSPSNVPQPKESEPFCWFGFF